MYKTFDFRCDKGHVHEALISSDAEPVVCATCGGAAERIFTPCTNMDIPAWMRAPGSNGSSADATDRNAEYFKSERHKNDRAQDERIVARRERLDGNLQKLEKRLEQNA